jgi:hypothetical protein
MESMPELAALDLTELTAYAVELRYDTEFWPPQPTAREAVSFVEKVRALILKDSHQRSDRDAVVTLLADTGCLSDARLTRLVASYHLCYVSPHVVSLEVRTWKVEDLRLDDLGLYDFSTSITSHEQDLRSPRA